MAIRYAVRGVIVDMVDGWRGVRLSMRGRDIEITRNENSLKNVEGNKKPVTIVTHSSHDPLSAVEHLQRV